MLDWFRDAVLGTGRGPALMLLIGFVVTFAVTRTVTTRIRLHTERGDQVGASRLKDVHIAGVHVHHQVWGILLVLAAGLLEFRFRPGSPGAEVLALLFGAGAALALDEFALWLHLQDVYWSDQGRKSIDAVIIAVVVGFVLLISSSPVEAAQSTEDPEPGVMLATVVGIDVTISVLCLLKGKIVLGLLGLALPILAVVGAMRLAMPDSFWARRFYGEAKRGRAQRRAIRVAVRRSRLVDVLGGYRNTGQGRIGQDRSGSADVTSLDPVAEAGHHDDRDS